MKIKWVRVKRCHKCHHEFGSIETSICPRCTAVRGNLAVMTDIPAGRYLMNFCTCTKSLKVPLTIRDSSGHLHLRLAAETGNTFHAGEL